MAAADREAPWPRDPFPVEALKKYVDDPPEYATPFILARDSALVAIGLRTMRRVGELANMTSMTSEKETFCGFG
jgi:hypothetical protein